MTAPLAALMATAWTLIVLLGLVSYFGLYRLDRKRAEGVDRATAAQGKGRRDCRSATSAGRRSAEIGEQQLRASRQTGAGGPT